MEGLRSFRRRLRTIFGEATVVLSCQTFVEAGEFLLPTLEQHVALALREAAPFASAFVHVRVDEFILAGGGITFLRLAGRVGTLLALLVRRLLFLIAALLLAGILLLLLLLLLLRG